MGSGIAQVAAQSGFEVIALDLDAERTSSALSAMKRRMDERVHSGKMGKDEAEHMLSRIHAGTSFQELAEADIVIEAVFERMEVKSKLLSELSPMLRKECVIGSNTSSIPITSLSRYVAHPSRFIGIHFFNPVPVMKLVEVIRGQLTSEETVSAATDIIRRMGKEPVTVSDFPGFVSNRLLMPMINEAAFALMEGVADAKSIDTVMKLGMNHPMGPLELADLIGLDVCLDIMNALYSGFRDSKYRPCPLLERMVNAGMLGRKSGRGFYTY